MLQNPAELHTAAQITTPLTVSLCVIGFFSSAYNLPFKLIVVNNLNQPKLLVKKDRKISIATISSLWRVGEGVILLPAVRSGTACWQRQLQKLSWMLDF